MKFWFFVDEILRVNFRPCERVNPGTCEIIAYFLDFYLGVCYDLVRKVRVHL